MNTALAHTRTATAFCVWCVALVASLLAGCGPGTAVRGEGAGELDQHRQETVEVDLPADGQWLAVAAAGERIYCLGQPLDSAQVSSADRYLLAIENSGKLLWRAEFELPPNAVPAYYTDLFAEQGVLVLLSDYVFMGLSPDDGSVLWLIDNQMASLRYVGVESGVLYAWEYPTTVRGYSVKDGTAVDQWEFTGYTGITDAWLSATGKEVVAWLDLTGEYVVATLEVGPDHGVPREVLREPNPYQFQTAIEGPKRFSGIGTQTYDRSDYVAKVTTMYERVTIEGWSIREPGPIWTKEIALDPEQYTAMYAPRFMLGRSFGLVQEPMSSGVILRNVLRLHLHHLAALERAWTNVVPTLDYISNIIELPGGLLLLHSINDQGITDRWYAFSVESGALVWHSRNDEATGQTRSMASNGKTIARLTTVNWMESRLFIDRLR